ncbi:MAG: TIM barrel protein [Chloroflexota bacterium]|nr:MAG: xylose isomerase [Chloroflexota bacterium]
MPPLRQSFSWDGFARTGIAPEALARGAADIGYEGVELIPEEYWPLVRDCGLRIVTAVGHPLAPEGLNRRENRKAIEAVLVENLRRAEAWNIPYLLCFSGNRYGVDEATAAEITAENLRAFAPMAADAGVTLILELLNSKVPGRDYQADKSAWGVQVCRMVNSPNVRLLYDIYHMQIMEGDIIRTIQENAPFFAHYHTAGNPGRNDLDDEQELNYRAIVRAIAATGYDGFIGHEFFPKGEAIAALRAAYETCRVGA